MHVERHTPAAFVAAASAFLTKREAENNLILGISGIYAAHPRPTEAYFATVHADAGALILLAVMRTPPNNVALSTFADGIDAATQRAALTAAAADVGDRFAKDVPGVLAPSAIARGFAEVWAAQVGCAVEQVMAERIYRLTRLIPPVGVVGEARLLREDDRALAIAWGRAFQEEAVRDVPLNPDVIERTVANALNPDHPNAIVLWTVAGTPVAMAGFQGETPHGMRVGPVYTPPDQRRRGYGAAVTAAATEAIFARGKTMAFLYTDLANPTSNKIYQQIGYEPVIDVDMLRFVRPR